MWDRLWQDLTGQTIPTRHPLPIDRQTTKTAATETSTTATMHAFHTAYTAPNCLRENNHPSMRYRNERMPLALPWTPSTTTTFAWRSLTPITIFFLVFPLFVMSKSCSLFFVFWYPPPYAIRQTKSVCALTRTDITCTSTNSYVYTSSPFGGDNIYYI